MKNSANKKEQSAYKPIVTAVEQAAKVLFCLGESSQFKMKLTDFCKEIGIYKSKGHSILNTLNQYGLVEKDPDNGHKKTQDLQNHPSG